MKTVLLMLALALVPDDGRAQVDQTPPTALATVYEPFSRNTPAELGRLRLSADEARFSVLKGSMRLRYAGNRPLRSDDGQVSGDVYAVLNAEAFAKANPSFAKACHAPVRWIILQPASGDGPIWVWFLTIDDWKAYRNTGDGVCRGDTFYPN